MISIQLTTESGVCQYACYTQKKMKHRDIGEGTKTTELEAIHSQRLRWLTAKAKLKKNNRNPSS